MSVASFPAPASSWYAIRSATRREQAAAEALQEQGFTTYLPMSAYWGLARLGGKRRVETPLLPGYLFVLTTPDCLQQVEDTEGVHQLVGYYDEDGASRALAIPVGAIIEIQANERAGLYDKTRHVKVPYRAKKGDRVKITCGPWLGFVAKVLATPKGSRVHVLTEGPFGRGTIVEAGHLSAA